MTLDDVRDVAADLLAAPPTLAVIGPFDESRDVPRGRGLRPAPWPSPGRAPATAVRVAVLGARGRMGAAVCRAVEAAADLRAGRAASTS